MMNFESNQLTLEQEFMHQVFVTKVRDLSEAETKELLIKFHKQMLFKDNLQKKLFNEAEEEIIK
ncbi:phycobilisome degradation protein nblA [Pleurocapsales cyanobacterium LEGE 10410]|nr:phycobilisome degradation protein nblA [Pleurocapsales cyanobacterium LEGE 10410]